MVLQSKHFLRYHLATHLQEEMDVFLSGVWDLVVFCLFEVSFWFCCCCCLFVWFLQMSKEIPMRSFRVAHYEAAHFVSKILCFWESCAEIPHFLIALDLWSALTMEIVIMNAWLLREENMKMWRTRWRSRFLLGRLWYALCSDDTARSLPLWNKAEERKATGFGLLLPHDFLVLV